MMTKDEIKKALVLCQLSAVSTCRDCPYTENCDGTQLYKDALNLITEQEKEIERLKDDYAKLQEQFTQYQKASDKEILAQVKQARIDVLNELKSKLYVNNYCREVIEVEKIDEVIKEIENAEYKS